MPKKTMYITLEDIKKLLPEEIIIQLTDDENTGAVNQARVDEAIKGADAEINSYCATKYAVPFTTVPDIVKSLSVEIAIYNLHKRRTISEEIEKRYDKAIAKLKDISRGLITLGVDPAPAATTEGGAETNKTESDRVFTRDSLRNF